MYIIVTNFGDDSVALIEWAHNKKLDDVVILSVETGWEDKNWNNRIVKAKKWINDLNFHHNHLHPKAMFNDNIIARKKFPSKKFHWCPSFVKGIVLLDWLDENDPNGSSTIMLPHRNSMTKSQIIEEYIEEHEHYDDRRVWFPLFNISEEKRNQLLSNTPFPPLNHRSLECQPCIYSSHDDLKNMSYDDALKAKKLEDKIKSSMFNPHDYEGANNVLEIREKLLSGAIKIKTHQNRSYYDEFSMSCSWSYGCGL